MKHYDDQRLSGKNFSIIDLRKAYLQLHVDPKLWRYQAVCYKEKYCYLTRLGFGLNCAPRIMSVILAKVLELDDSSCKGHRSLH